MSRMLIAIAPLLILALGTALPSSNATPTKDEIEGLFEQWNSALATLNASKVVALYSADAVLLPTLSNKIRTTPAEITDYFDHFLLNKPQGVIDESHVHLWSPILVARDGIYTFSLSRAGSNSTIQARFTFVYRKENGAWKIAEHHSSAMPEQNLPTNKEIAGLFTQWNSALATLNASTVVALYSADAVLLPTLSNKIRTTPAEIMDYFDHFLLNRPQGVIDESYVHLWSPTLATRDGIYTFSLSRAGGNSTLQARFSFVYHKENGAWKIAEHHSSAMPEQKLPTDKEVEGLFEQWNNALATLNASTVVALYSADAVLLPTLSNKIRTTPAEIMDYFDHFLRKKPQGVIDESHVHLWSPTLATRDGIYTFTFSRACVKSRCPKLQARYSFVYHKENGEWKIAEHHSSVMPEQTPPTSKEGGKRVNAKESFALVYTKVAGVWKS